MEKTINELIYEKFFENLTKNKNVRPATVEALKAIYSIGRITNRNNLADLTQEMEARHAQDQKFECL
jgi:hypothetical protein